MIYILKSSTAKKEDILKRLLINVVVVLDLDGVMF